MYIEKLENIGPAGDGLRLHRRLTVLRSAPPAVMDRLISLFGALSLGDAISESGTFDVNGVSMNLDPDSLRMLQIAPFSGGVVDVGATSRNPRTHPAHTQPTPTQPDVAPSVDEVPELRTRLRETADERIALAEQMDQVRERLDSFAEAALDVCLGQIDALEGRRSRLRTQWLQTQNEKSNHAERLEASIAAREQELRAVESLDLAHVLGAAQELSSELSRIREPDQEALELALKIDSAMRRHRDLIGRYQSLELKRREIEQRLAEAVAESEAAVRSVRFGVLDPALVARLEAVRDEMFASDDRPSRLSVNRNRKRMAALREEEADLLGQLGFDTYSSYVMGIPSTRAEIQRAAIVDRTGGRVDEIEAELDRLSGETPSRALVDTARMELVDLLARAEQLLKRSDGLQGQTPPLELDEDSGIDSDFVANVLNLLRKTQIVGSNDRAPEVELATAHLRSAIAELGGGIFLREGSSEPPTIAGVELSAAAWSGTARDLVAGVERWIEQLGDRNAWLSAAADEIELLRSETEKLGSDSTNGIRDEWAEVESELDTMLDRLGKAQERVRSHEAAMAELADMRELELDIRSRERGLLERIGEIESAATVLPSQRDQDSDTIRDSDTVQDSSTMQDSATPDSDSGRVGDFAADPGIAQDPEWRIVRTAARRLSVSFAGSLPMLVVGSPVDREVGESVVHRLSRLSDMIQIVVIADTDWFGSLFESICPGAEIVRY